MMASTLEEQQLEDDVKFRLIFLTYALYSLILFPS